MIRWMCGVSPTRVQNWEEEEIKYGGNWGRNETVQTEVCQIQGSCRLGKEKT